MLPDQPRYLCSAMLKLDTAARELDKKLVAFATELTGAAP